MDRTTVKRQTDYMDSVLDKVLPTISNMGERLAAIEDSEEFSRFVGGGLIHDGTLTTALDSKDKENEETSGFSGKHHSAGFNTVLTCGFNGLLVHTSRVGVHNPKNKQS